MTTTIDDMFVKFSIEPLPEDAQMHGIKGQRWGVRRERGEAGTVSSAINSKPTHLSDSDLRDAVNRMQLERTFAQLHAERNPRVEKGDGFVKSFLKEQGKKQVKRVANSAADIAVEQALAKLGAKTGNTNITELSKRIKPKKK